MAFPKRNPAKHTKDPVAFLEALPVAVLTVRNTGDRPVQVGSHFHFFEVNRQAR